ncbi:hypothetical protein [Shewanella algae]|uniref:hypothetical protein n=2 Tax=Shewanella TaxID=22 RepID=UPI001182DF2E|nr:hypothetical protein [Shewanella algae]MBO2553321.1 hypothetical protein [Shewanella algae]MBO2637983.1 hypothetical protein [Shewanella algae]MDO8256220.1 hypothetical protein [Shewanella algae]
MRTIQLLYAMSMNSIKVMTDYQCFPIWHYGCDNVGEIDPATLPISKELVASLLVWASIYDATLNSEDPINSGFLNESAQTDFIEKGLELAQKLKSELKNTEVYYYHEGMERDVRI